MKKKNPQKMKYHQTVQKKKKKRPLRIKKGLIKRYWRRL